MEKEILEETLLETEVAMEFITQFVVDLERVLNRLEKEKGFFTKRDKRLFYCASQMTTSGGRKTEKLLKHDPPVYLEFACNLEKASLRY